MLFKSLQVALCRRFATKLQAASTKNKKDSAGKRLGVKIFGGEWTFPNDILVRQRGFKMKPGLNTNTGRDHTIHAKIEGKTKFTKEYIKGRKVTTVHVLPDKDANRTIRPPLPYCFHPELYPELAKHNPEHFQPPTRIRKVIEAKPARNDLPVKIGTTDSVFKVSLPERFMHAGDIVIAKQENKEEVDIFDEFTAQSGKRYNELKSRVDKFA